MAVTVITCPTVSFPSTATQPNNTICIDHFGEKVNGHDDAGGLYQGYLCYRSAGTQKNDFTVASDEFGDAAAEGTIYAVERQVSDAHQSYNFADEAYSANDPIVVVRLEIGKKYWLKVSGETVVEDTLYNAVGGTVGAIDDPTPDAITKSVHIFRCLALATTLTGWCPFEYQGYRAIDTAG